MNFILEHQYELLYSFGALFAFFSMLSYVVPAAEKVAKAVRGETSMDSSDQFFDGFEGPDIESIMAASGMEDDEDEEASVLSLGGN